MQIRHYRPTDFDRLYDIDQLCFAARIAYSRPELALYIRHARSITRVAELAGEAVGFVIGKLETSSRAHVVTLDVLPEVRRRRIGTALMETLHGEFSSLGVRVSVLEVNAEDMTARIFYEKLSYRYSGILRDYYGQGLNAWRMFLVLGPPRGPEADRS